MLINATDLTGYNYCARKLFLKLVLNIREPVSKHLLLGKLLHEFIEKLNKQEENTISSLAAITSLEGLKASWNVPFAELLKDLVVKEQYEVMGFGLDLAETYRLLWELAKGLIEERAALIYDTYVKTGLTGQDLWQAIQPKLIAEQHIEDPGLQLKGRIDQVEDYGSFIVPREFKTGKAPAFGAWKDHQLQLASYALLLEAKWNKPINRGFIYYLGSGQRIDQPINHFIKDEVKELIKKVNLMVEHKDVPDFVSNKNKCINCGVREKCYNKALIDRLTKKALSTKVVQVRQSVLPSAENS